MSRYTQRKIKRYICKCLQWLSLGGMSRDFFMCLLRGIISYSLFSAGITDYHTLSSLKLYKFIISQFHTSPVGPADCSALGFIRPKSRCVEPGLLPEGSGGTCFSRFFYIVERIRLHVILRSKLPIFLLAVTRGSSSQFLEPVRILWLHFQSPQQWVKTLSRFASLLPCSVWLFSDWIQLEKFLLF